MNLLRKLLTVACGTLTSRIFGFIREMFMAIALGTGPIADAFNAAFRFPNTFRRLFAEGAFNSAFVPLFSKEIEGNGKKQALKFSEEVLGVLFTLLLIITLIMELSMPLLVRYLIAPGFSNAPQQMALTIKLAMIMFPYLICMSLAAMMAGMLNALHHYFAAAIAPVFLNIILICILFYCWRQNIDPYHIGLFLSWGVLSAGLVQLAIVTYAVCRAGMRLKFCFPKMTPNVKRLLWLALPAAITGGITQINLVVSTSIASSQIGAVSSLIYADRLYQLPLGMVGIAVATVLLPELSRALRGKNPKTSYHLQNRAIEFTLLLTLPAVAGFLLISYPIVQVIFEHGQFTAQSTSVVASILSIYGLGLPAFVLIKNFIPAFFAREDTKTPLIFAGLSALTNIILAFSLFPYFSVQGIAAGEVIAGWLNALLLFFTLVKRQQWQGDLLLLKRFIVIILGVLLMSACLLFILHNTTAIFTSTVPLLKRIISLSTLIGSAIFVYFAAILLFGGKSMIPSTYLQGRKKS